MSSEEDDDDVLFDDIVDKDVEWGGIQLYEEGKSDYVGCKAEASGSRSKEKKKPKLDTTIDLNDPKFELGQLFSDTALFRKAVREHSIKSGRDVKFTVNHKFKVQVKCKHKACPWVIYASKVQGEDSMKVKRYDGRHECPRKQKNSHANSRWVANMYKDEISSNPRWPIESMLTVLKRDVSLIFNKWQMYKAKKFVSEMGTGTDMEQYGMLWSYAEEVRRSNPGTTVKIKSKLVNEQPHFKRIYICWDSLKKGFLEGCRPVICLDGCHLKTTYGGVLLTALGVDGNNSMYPFAYAVVEKEKTKSWTWFIDLIKLDLDIQNNSHWTIISDKQKGLVDAIDKLLLGCEHRFCVQHLYNNFKKDHKGLALKGFLWRAARATRVQDFSNVMAELKARDIAAYEWLAQRAPHQWSKSHFSCHSKCDMLLNNLSENFNSVILRARDKPILTMLETIRLILMKSIYKKREKIAAFHGELCPSTFKLLEELKKKSMNFVPHWNGENQFEIGNGGLTKFNLHLKDQTCTCRKWELTGIPCEHAISGLYFMGLTPEDHVSHWCKRETVLKAYVHVIGTMNPADQWPHVDIEPLVPPKYSKMPGRPKKHSRKKQPDEVTKPRRKKEATKVKLSRKGLTMTCSACHKPNHNVRRCPLSKEKHRDDIGLDIPAPIANKKNQPKTKGKKRKLECMD